jgi:CHAT domain-containing protein
MSMTEHEYRNVSMASAPAAANRPRVVAILITTFLVITTFIYQWRDRRQSTHSGMAALTAATERSSARTIQPRLSGAWPYKPFRRAIRAAGENAHPIGADVGDDRHALALAFLLGGEPDRAIRMLNAFLHENASVLDSAGVTRADVLAEIASAEYEVAAGGGEPFHFAAAFEHAARALALSPQHLGALHVRALSLEALSLREDAIDGWRDYLAQDARSPWAVEARTRLMALDRDAGEDPSDALVRAADSGDTAALAKLIKGRPQYARVLVEETLLGAWGDAVAQHEVDSATSALRRSHIIADALAKGGDGVALASVDRITRADQPSRMTLAAAHRAFTAARKAFAAASDAKARDALGEAARLLDATRSPLAVRAWTAYATVSHYLGHTDEARGILTHMTETLRGSEAAYPVATGESWWMLGLIEQSQGRSAAALHDYDTARIALERAGEPSHLAGISSVLSETYRYIGEFNQAWSSNVQALRWADLGGTYKRRQIVTNDAALLAMESGYPRLAEHIAQRVEKRAATAHDRIFATLGLLTEGRALASRQRTSDAQNVLDRTAATLETTRRDGSTLRLIADVAATRGELATRTDPPEAVRLISSAFEQLHNLNDRSRLAKLHLVFARAKRAAGDDIGEEHELAAGLAQLESQRELLDDDQERSTFTDTGRALYDDTVRRLLAREQSSQALQVVRRARTIGVTTPGALASDAMSSGAAAPAGSAFVEYYLLDDSLLTWVTVNGSTELIRSSSTSIREVVQREVAALSRCTTTDDCLAESRRLYDLLIASAAPAIAGADELLIAPDGILHLVPFAALYDAREKCFVAERHAVSIVLSALPPATDRARFESIFVAVPQAPDDMPQLAAAAREARAAARAFRTAALVDDRSATAARFLAEAGRYDVAHFAGHGVWNERNPRLASLRFAADAAHPDGAMHADELRGSDPGKTRLVVLAACDTARGQVTNAGALSFARAFAARGVPAVVGSLWPVDDEASEQFFTSFYGALARGKTPAEALRAAQRDSISRPDAGLGLWGAFQLYVGSKRAAEKGTL